MVAGRALGQAKQRDQAIAQLERAEQDLAGRGAYSYSEQAQKELRRLGRRVTRRTGTSPVEGLSALTEREREIAAMVSRGRTNREIASASYLSEKTVERHLSHIFAKLGVASRAGLAALVVTGNDRDDR
jgi:DNA-binding NarL/FixJ family response regulator